MLEITKLLERELGKDLIKKESLRKHTYIKIGGPAQYFYTAKNLDNLIYVVKLAQKNQIPYIVIGSGSNLIVADSGFEGLVIKNETAGLIFGQKATFAESGIKLHWLIRKLAEADLGGLEFLAGIPGTLGGAIYGNAGAYGKSMANLVDSITVLDSDGQIKQIANEDFDFSYRGSILKTRAKIDRSYYNQPVIISARLRITPNNKESILRVVENYLKIRDKKIPIEPSAGCVFKNIEILEKTSIDPKLRIFIIDNKLPAGLLIDKAIGKKIRVGKLAISAKHANFIINRGRGKAIDFYHLVQIIKQKVKEKFAIELEEEIEYVGEVDQKRRGILGRVFKK